MRLRWQQVCIVMLLWGGVSFVTRGDSCNGDPPPATVVATAPPGTPIDQLPGVVVIVSYVDAAGKPVVGITGELSWSSDTSQIAGTNSSGISDSNGEITFSGFGDADFGTWNMGVDTAGNFFQSISRPRRANNPNRVTYVVKVLPSPSPSPSVSASPSPSPSPSTSASPSPSPSVSVSPTPTPSATATDTPPVVTLPDTGGGTTPTGAVAGSGPVSTRVIITNGSPQAAYPHATLP